MQQGGGLQRAEWPLVWIGHERNPLVFQQQVRALVHTHPDVIHDARFAFDDARRIGRQVLFVGTHTLFVDGDEVQPHASLAGEAETQLDPMVE